MTPGCVSHDAVLSKNLVFIDKVASKGSVRLIGGAKLSGEFEIYSDYQSLEARARFPNCISAVFSDQYARRDLSTYDGRLVSVVGDLFTYQELPDEDRAILPR